MLPPGISSLISKSTWALAFFQQSVLCLCSMSGFWPKVLVRLESEKTFRIGDLSWVKPYKCYLMWPQSIGDAICIMMGDKKWKELLLNSLTLHLMSCVLFLFLNLPSMANWSNAQLHWWRFGWWFLFRGLLSVCSCNGAIVICLLLCIVFSVELAA